VEAWRDDLFSVLPEADEMKDHGLDVRPCHKKGTAGSLEGGMSHFPVCPGCKKPFEPSRPGLVGVREPGDLSELVRKRLADQPELHWKAAVTDISREST